MIEGCGSWGQGLATWLQSRGEDVREIDSPRRPARRMGKKTDDLDALRVTREALGRENLATPRATGDRDALATLLTSRRSAISMACDTERQLTALASTCPEPLADRLRGNPLHKRPPSADAGAPPATGPSSQRQTRCVGWRIVFANSARGRRARTPDQSNRGELAT